MDTLLNAVQLLSETAVKVCFFNILSPFGIGSIELPIGVFILLFFIIVFNVYLEFVPVKSFFGSIVGFFKKKKESKVDNSDGISSVSAILTTVAANTGLGSTAGSALMIAVAGPGTVFWLPFAIMFCLAIKMTEIYLGHKYREKEENGFVGGPFLYLKKGLAEKNLPNLGKYLSSLYLVLMLIVGFFGVSVVEMNQFTKIVVNQKVFAGQEFLVSVVGVLFVGVIIVGGIKRISQLFNFLMPILVSLFIFFSIVTIAKNSETFFSACRIIYEDAFNIKAGFGAMIASIIMVFRRVAISTETGLGTAGIIHAASKEESSIKEAMTGMISPAISGFFISFLTSFLIIATGVYKFASAKDGIVTVSYALEKGFWFFPPILLVLTVIMALNVTIGWSYYGVSYATKIFGKKAKNPCIAIYLTLGLIGGLLNDFQIIMNFVDAFAFILIAVNLIGISFLIKDVKKEMMRYVQGKN